MLIISLLIIILLGLWLPLVCLYLLAQKDYSFKQLMVDGLVTLAAFFLFLFGANHFNLSNFDGDSLNSFGILISLMTTLIRKGDIYKILPYNGMILVSLKGMNLLFYMMTAFFFQNTTTINPLLLVGLEVIKCLLAIGLTIGLKKIVTTYKLAQELHYKNNLSIKIALSSLVVYVVLYGAQFLFRGELPQDYQDDIIPIFILSVLIIIIIWLTNYTKNKRNVDLLAEKELLQQQLLDYMTMLETSQQEVRKFKHDYKNMLLSMNGYIVADDLMGLKEYFNQQILPESSQVVEPNSLNALSNLQVIELKGILMTKLTTAQTQGLTVTLEITEPIRELNLGIIDSCRVLGILLDNAIEGSQLSLAKELKIAFISYPTSLEIIIQNSILEPVPAIHLCFQTGFSTKGDNRGLGLSNVGEIINQYPQATLNTTNQDGYFSQHLQISTGGA